MSVAALALSIFASIQAAPAAPWADVPIATPASPSDKRTETLPIGTSGCDRLARATVDLGLWRGRSTAAEAAPMRIAALETVATTMNDLAADQLGRDLAASLRDLSALMERDQDRREEMLAEIRTLHEELVLARLALCSRPE